MPSKRRSGTTQTNRKPPDPTRFFLDRNLGTTKLATQLRSNGIDVVIHDDVYAQTERDPWIFYHCGVQNLVVVTSDRDFMKLFPHMAAVRLGRTTILAFTGRTYNSVIRGAAFIKCHGLIQKTIKQMNGRAFIAVIGAEGSFRVLEKDPVPTKKQCDAKDWESYEKVCHQAGILPLRPNHDHKASVAITPIVR